MIKETEINTNIKPDEQNITEQIVKRKSNGRNSPVIGYNGYDIDNPEAKALVSKLLNEGLEAYRMPKVHSDEELLDRLDEYFVRCANEGIKPTVEEMCMFTGYTLQTVWDWEVGRKKGFSGNTSDIIKKAKNYMGLFDAKLLLEGKINPVSYIFRAKNYYGMKDVQDFIVTPNNPLGDDVNPETIAEKYKDALPPAETETE